MSPTDLTFQDALVFTGGGTGGHLFPAIALAEGARARWPGRPIAFVGAQRGIEARELPRSAWPHLLLDVEGLVGRSPVRALTSLWKLWKATRTLRTRWRAERPWAVIGTGGYGAAPALLAARSLGIPYFLHESNAAPGALIKLLAPKAARVWCGMEAVRALLPSADTRVVGTPVREAFLRDFQPATALQQPRRLLALGGSGGARAINEALLALAPALLEAHPEWEILHQAGPAEAERLKDQPRHARHVLVAFLNDMDQVMEASSLIMGRSGASTCAELKAVGRAAVLVPLPTSAGDHQRMNARAMVAEGRARLVEQGEGFSQRLGDQLAELMGSEAARQALSCAPERNTAVEACLSDVASYLG